LSRHFHGSDLYAALERVCVEPASVFAFRCSAIVYRAPIASSVMNSTQSFVAGLPSQGFRRGASVAGIPSRGFTRAIHPRILHLTCGAMAVAPEERARRWWGWHSICIFHVIQIGNPVPIWPTPMERQNEDEDHATFTAQFQWAVAEGYRRDRECRGNELMLLGILYFFTLPPFLRRRRRHERSSGGWFSGAI